MVPLVQACQGERPPVAPGPSTSPPPHRDVEGQDDPEVVAALAAVLAGSPVPGAVAAVCRCDGPTSIGAWGERKAGGQAPMEAHDAVHVGSDTKAMTAALAARQVDAGLLRWDSTLEEVLPSLANRVDEAYRTATLTQFLRHTSGAPANPRSWRAFGDLPLRERRVEIAAAALAEPPAAPPGAEFLYSNLGYMVAGAMVEAVRDAPWEELMVTDVFLPLGIEGAGFGVPGTIGEEDAPWGHTLRRGTARPIQADNDPALGPAGTVHLPVADWARFVLQFTDAAADLTDDPFLSTASRTKLTEVGRGGYAFGWMVTERGWAQGVALTHSGSNTTWFATAWVAPRIDRAYLVAVNAAGAGIPGLVDRAIGALIALDR